jgi:hypothetical protein
MEKNFMMYILSYKTQKLIAENYEIPDDVFYELHDFCDSSVDLKNRMKDIILEYLNKSSDLILHDGTVNFRYNELTKQLFKIKKDIQTLYDLVSLKPEDLEEIIVGNEYYFEFDNDFLDNFSAEVQSFYLYEDTYFKYSFTINVKIKKIKEDFKDEGSILIPEVNLTNITLV